MDRILQHLIAAVLTVMTVVAGGSAPTTPAPGHGYVWPLSPQPQVMRGFEPPPQPWAAGHRGVDLLGKPGQTVHAAGAGTVSFSGVIAGVGMVTVTHANGWHTTYQPVDDRVAVGTKVTPGARIGALSSEGSHCAPSTCLHWGLLVGPDSYRDPLTLLERRKPILLPLG